MSSSQLVSVDFEVYGEVQGVFFRKYTADTAKSKQCVGWAANTYHGTVRGVVQGKPVNVDYMKDWLQQIGSPMSKIYSAKFTQERKIDTPEYSTFQIRY